MGKSIINKPKRAFPEILILLKPDFLENKDDWPFLWGENEVTIGGCVEEYIFLSCAVNDMIQKTH